MAQAMLYGITVDGCWAGKGMEKVSCSYKDLPRHDSFGKSVPVLRGPSGTLAAHSRGWDRASSLCLTGPVNQTFLTLTECAVNCLCEPELIQMFLLEGQLLNKGAVN